MAHFPLFIDITHKKCLVVGGGRVALRKVETLLRYEAKVEVIAESICPEIREMLPADQIRYGGVTETDFEDAVLVVAATASREVNHRVYEACARDRIPVNVVDAPEECTFLFPAVVKRGDISIGINTGGKSPLVSSHIRKQIEEAVPDDYGEIAKQLGQLREYGKEHFPDETVRRAILKAAASEAFAKGGVLTREEIDKILKEKGINRTETTGLEQ
ncbi:MAG: bifunctional precorrin-2 dehydrogenase/sirohydrochlorin ferrochelatase [Clostridiales bacterium]|nr:bifunctional precorrin-2 dehydrogenase/sirohydrochlorin ferrochelatase [Clostridiales bacterium]